MNLTRKNLLITGVTIFTLVASSLFIITSRAEAESLHKVCESSYDPTSHDLRKLSDCVKHYVDKSVKEKGYVQTEIDLEASIEKMPVINQVCHPFSHYIGAGAIKELDGNIDLAIKHATDYCNWGYFHGMNVELANLYKGQELFDVLLRGCEYVKKFNYNEFECAHGMGDAFDVAENMEIEKSMEWCLKIEEEGMALNCTQGVANHWADYYVVNVVKENLDKIDQLSPLIQEIMNGNPYVVCEKFTERLSRSGCFNYLVRVNNAYKTGMEDWEKYCNKFKDPDLTDCFQGVGREWAYNKAYTTEEVFNKCKVALSDRAVEICVIETINSRTQYMRDKEGKILNETCAIFKNDPVITNACQRAKKALMPYFNGDFVM